MREIKFRGKRLDNGEWVYGDLINENYGTGIGAGLFMVWRRGWGGIEQFVKNAKGRSEYGN